MGFTGVLALFAPYYEKTAVMMLTMLKCIVDSDARVAGAEALTSIIIFAFKSAILIFNTLIEACGQVCSTLQLASHHYYRLYCL
jgi:hypothetical protein